MSVVSDATIDLDAVVLTFIHWGGDPEPLDDNIDPAAPTVRNEVILGADWYGIP